MTERYMFNTRCVLTNLLVTFFPLNLDDGTAPSSPLLAYIFSPFAWHEVAVLL